MKAFLMVMATAALASCASTTGGDGPTLFNPAKANSTIYVAMAGS